MLYKFPMPKLGWTMEKGKVLKWFKNQGDDIQKGEDLIEVETDKVTLKVEAPATGTLARVTVKIGESVPVGVNLAIISDEPVTDEELDKFIADIQAEEAKIIPAAQATGAAPGVAQKSRTARTAMITQSGTVLASPKARKIASERGIDLHKIRGTGPGGVIQAIDVESQANRQGTGSVVERIPPDDRLTVVQEIPVEGIRKVIATRMFASLQTAAQLTITTEVFMDLASDFRDGLNAKRAVIGQANISFTDVLVLVVSNALARFSKFNASFDGEVIRYFKEINIGVAAATDRGLLVPVVWNANALSLEEISEKVKALSTAARSGTIKPDELSGGTFTITNLGMFGIDAFTPIINPPEIAILGVGRIAVKPAYLQGSMKPAQIMVLSLSFDHQIIDGHEAANFLQDLKNTLESSKKLQDIYSRRMNEKLEAEFLQETKQYEYEFDVAIIGAGPAANEAALTLASRKMKVAIIEKNVLGGTCLNRGCVPLKNLFNLADLKRKVGLRVDNDSGITNNSLDIDIANLVMKKDLICQNMQDGMVRQYQDASIQVIMGTAAFVNDHALSVEMQDGTSKEITFHKAIIATGSEFPDMSDDSGDKLPDAKDIFNLKEFPESIAFVGNDKITLELASIVATLGVEDVHVVWLGGIDLPFLDDEVKGALVESLELQNIVLHEPVAITTISKDGDGFTIELVEQGDKTSNLSVNLAVNAMPRIPTTAGLNLEAVGIELEEDGRVKTRMNLMTSNPHVFAIGDVVNSHGMQYTYHASAQGRAVAGAIINAEIKLPGKEQIPAGLFTLPPAASIGFTEKACTQGQIKYEKYYMPYSRLVTAHLVHEINGMVKVISKPETREILGVQVLGELAHEVIAIASMAIRKKATIDDLLDALQLHPTFGELFKEIGFQASLKKK